MCATLMAALALTGATGCGDDDEDAATTTPTVTETTATEPGETSAEPERETDTTDDSITPVGNADVTLTEYEVALAKRRLPAEGVYTLRIANDGDVVHALTSEGPNGETETEEIPPGESAELDAYFVGGTYNLYCPIGDHEQRGMKTTLRVSE